MSVRAVVLATLLLVAPVAASAQSYAIQGVERYLRVESSTTQGRRGPLVVGYVYNLYGHPADRVRLAVETLDASGNVTATAFVHLLGVVPVDGRSYFEAPAPAGGTSYRVRVLSFDPTARGGN
jgi:hypothetical protein